MNKIFYRHCLLKKENISTHSWVPENFAIIGNRVRIKRGEDWETGWFVETASNSLMEEKLIENQAHNCGNIWKPSTLLTNRGNK